MKGGLQLKNVIVQMVCEAMGEKNGKDKQQAKKFCPIVNQMPTPRLKHLKI
jgi:ribosomal protein L33